MHFPLLFWSQIFETEFLMELRLLRSPNCENHLFADGLSVCLSFSLCVWERERVYNQYNLKTNSSRKFKLGSLNIDHTEILREIVCDDCCNGLHIRTSRRTQIHYGLLDAFFQCILMCLNYTKRNKMTMHFSHAQKHVFYGMWFEYHSEISYGTSQKTQIY